MTQGLPPVVKGLKKFINAVLHETESVHCLNDVYVRAGKRVFRVVLQVAHLNFYEAHHPNFERLILNCLSSVGQAASRIY